MMAVSFSHLVADLAAPQYQPNDHVDVEWSGAIMLSPVDVTPNYNPHEIEDFVQSGQQSEYTQNSKSINSHTLQHWKQYSQYNKSNTAVCINC